MTAKSMQALRFLLTGLLVTFLHVFIAISIIQIGLLPPYLANAIAFVGASLFSYLLNTIWSFSSPLESRNFIRFILVSCLGLVLAMFISGLAEYYRLNYWYGIFYVVSIVTPISFLMHNFWTYK
jgi:putative flippase GtrA